MAKSKTYEMLLKIKGKTDSSLNSACLETSKNLDTLGAAAQKAGQIAATALAGIATAAAGVAASSLSAYSEFEAAMDSTAVTARATETEYELMEAAAREMGAKTTKTATEAAEAMGYMALAGWDVEESMAGLEPILRASEATGMDLARCSDLVTDSMSALGLGVGDMTDYLDLAVQAQRASNTTAESLLEAFIGCGGAAKTAGVDMGDLSTALGVLANNGTKGSEAGTALNSMLSRMTTNTAALSAFKDLGVAVFDSAGNFRGLETVLGDTSAALSNLSDAERLAYMKNIAGTNYFTEMSYLLDAVAEGADGAASAWSNLETDIMDHKDVLLEVAKANTDNLAGATAIFQSAVSELQLQIGEQLAPYAKEGLEYLANNVLPVVSEKAGEIIPMIAEAGKALWENRNTILAVGGAVVTAVGAFKGLQMASAAAGAVKNLSTIFKAASKSGSLFSKVMSVGNLKLALIAGGIAVLVAAFVLLWNKSEKFRETVTVLWRQLQTLGGALADMAGAIWEKVAPLLAMLGNALLNGLEQTVELLAPMAGDILGIFTGIADFITGVFSGDWDQALRGLQTIFESALSRLGNLAVAGFTAILEIGTSIWPTIDSAVQAGIAAISSRFPVLGAVLGSLWSTVQKVWSNIQVILQNAIQFVQNVFSGNWSAAWQNVVNIFGAIFSTMATIAMTPMNMLASGVQSAINSVAAFLQEKFPFLGALFSGWAASISAAIENIKAVFSGIISFIENVFAGNWSAAWQNIVDIFGNLFGMIVNLAKAPINGVVSAINFVLEKVNSISVTIPDWVPGVGGQTLGFNLPTIPQLATGGVVTAPTILEAGEGGEPEAVLPLSKLDAMLKATQQTPEQAMEITVLLPGLTETIAAWKNAQSPAPPAAVNVTTPELPPVTMPEYQAPPVATQAPPAAVNVTTPEPPPITMPEYPAPPTATPAPPAAVSMTTPELPPVTMPEYQAPPAATQAPPAAVNVTTPEPPPITMPEYPAPLAATPAPPAAVSVTTPELPPVPPIELPETPDAPTDGILEAGRPLSKLGDLLENMNRNRIEIPDPDGGNDTPFIRLVASINRMIQGNTGTDKDDPGTMGNYQGPPAGSGDKDPPLAETPQSESGGPTPIVYSPVFNFNGAAPTKEEAEETGRISFAEFKRLHDKLETEDRRKNLRTR